ncbi:uncharacterized protein LTHEOB_1867 [Neofusicoccum parvum]|nr:uncharacterized protein LTHEOB_1867 [Neofusicoccum parvum]
MADTTHLAAAQEPNDRPRPPPNRRRDKPQLSCTLCRRRKLKCDRNQPCGTCSNRGLSYSCTYVSSTPSAINRVSQSRRYPQASPGMQDRINQLEGLVVTLMNSVNVKPSPTPALPTALNAQDTELSDSFGRISLENDETRYVSGDHWIAILDGIAELKDHFEDNNARPGSSHFPESSQDESDGPRLLFGCNSHATKESILSLIPPRPVADRLVSKYFNAMDIASSMIHGPTFLKDYEKFWLNPSETPLMWLGLLYALMALGTHIQQRESSPLQVLSDHQKVLDAYKEKVVQCLILGKYTKVVPHTIETLLLYFSLEHLPAADTRVDNWVLAGIIVRVAMRQGYHRDPSHTPQIKPFHAEMRRRHWATIVQLDLMSSTQVGLPRMVNESVCDTAEPRNLLDNDFDEDIIDLPPPRPDTDMTPMLYLNTRNKLLSVYGMITDLTTSTWPSSYRDVMQLDRTLHNTRATIPAGLQLRPLSRSITDDGQTIIRRIHLDMTFNRARCILHRKYLTAARKNAKYGYSRTSCMEAAVQILKHQEVLHREVQPGGRLSQEIWMLTSVLNHDFLLAITILCLDLNCDMELAATSQLVETAVEQERRDKVIYALQQSYKIWVQTANSSHEARKAAEVLRIVLDKAKRAFVSSPADGMDDSSEEVTPPMNDFSHADASFSLQSNVAWDYETPMDPFAQALNLFDEASPQENMGDFSGIAQSDGEFDWDSWDAHFRSQNPADLSTLDSRLSLLDEQMM